jgi:hypothetical protein
MCPMYEKHLNIRYFCDTLFDYFFLNLQNCSRLEAQDARAVPLLPGMACWIEVRIASNGEPRKACADVRESAQRRFDARGFPVSIVFYCYLPYAPHQVIEFADFYLLEYELFFSVIAGINTSACGIRPRCCPRQRMQSVDSVRTSSSMTSPVSRKVNSRKTVDAMAIAVSKQRGKFVRREPAASLLNRVRVSL